MLPVEIRMGAAETLLYIRVLFIQLTEDRRAGSAARRRKAGSYHSSAQLLRSFP